MCVVLVAAVREQNGDHFSLWIVTNLCPCVPKTADINMKKEGTQNDQGNNLIKKL